ncbi:hypothetical protein HQN90_26350 [Paenibacillus alba]|uniref:SWIM zinc finger family protein n=1 Tax=Paenibacillus alba TaxID=1197127 RepID=UPI0015671532|nr:hypothetical protein [Paenibacillus alba]NQX69658.1 hypothetical protein [Paenibacillus alba]
MKLKDFEKIVDQITFERGKAYREKGHIVSVEEVEPLMYHAEVKGSQLYEVEVHLGSRGEVMYAACDCPLAIF